MKKKDRQNLIIQLISSQNIYTQDQLTNEINRFGFNVSQATVSRDIEELNLIKVKEGNKLKYTRPIINNENVSQSIIDLLKQVKLNVIVANNLVLVKTLSGNAGTAGMAVDQMTIKEVLGTVAGDDTLLIITKDDKDAILVKNLIDTL